MKNARKAWKFSGMDVRILKAFSNYDTVPLDFTGSIKVSELEVVLSKL